MKKVAVVILLMIFLSSCTVQKKMSPWIFIERVEKNDKNIAFDTGNSFYENEDFVCYATYADMSGFCVEILTDESGNSKKISLACMQTDKTDKFISFSKSVIETYSPDDSADEVIKSLFGNKKINNVFAYHSTQWYDYSAILSENGFYFSVASKKLMPQSEVEFSLKPNDIIEY